jgi:hypothetical protein
LQCVDGSHSRGLIQFSSDEEEEKHMEAKPPPQGVFHYYGLEATMDGHSSFPRVSNEETRTKEDEIRDKVKRAVWASAERSMPASNLLSPVIPKAPPNAEKDEETRRKFKLLVWQLPEQPPPTKALDGPCRPTLTPSNEHQKVRLVKKQEIIDEFKRKVIEKASNSRS